MASSHINRVKTAALERGGSSTHRNMTLGKAIAAAIKARCSMEDIMKASHVTDVQRVIDLATIGGFVATCTSDDFRDAASILEWARDYGVMSMHDKAVIARVSAMLRKMAVHYDATVQLNARMQKEKENHDTDPHRS